MFVSSFLPSFLQGGKFVLTVKGEDSGQLDQWWLHAVLAAIGEILEVNFSGIFTRIPSHGRLTPTSYRDTYISLARFTLHSLP